MARVLIKVQNKEIVFRLKQYGEVEPVMSFENIYGMSLDDKTIECISSLDGVVKVERNETFDVQI